MLSSPMLSAPRKSLKSENKWAVQILAVLNLPI
jgi:hypothetical protein